ncbi:MAG: sulfotransferase [Bryobacterales bacterium]|nr:sulfotransferase [Bryobacterales bacterium]
MACAASAADCPDARYLDRLGEMPSSLIFIMGCHRSGTSMLHHLLAHTGQVNYVTTYDVVHYNSLLANRITGAEAAVKAELQDRLRAVENRGLDHLPVGADLPEEYRFVLTSFDISFTPRARWRIDEIFAPHLTPQALPRLVELCRKKQFLAGRDQPLVLKDPADYYFNFLAVHRMLPGAKFVFIHRHPLQVLNSYLLSFSPMMEKKSSYWSMLDEGYARLFSVRPVERMVAAVSMRTGWYARLVLRRLVESFHYYLENISRIPQDQCVVVRYEDLCRDPGACLQRIGSRLGLALEPRIPERFVTPRNRPVLERALRQYVRQRDALLPYLDHLQYQMWPTPCVRAPA